ncbi:ABC transporter ATP-binding protein [Opitutaceae bacterium TAV3]|nr:ABC transporter ATP-binding protein [Opitutaceae bacterium TAV3]
MLACRHLNVYPKPGAPPLVRDATARWAAGQLHALIGPSGCGKTTLLKGMLGILPAQGEIRLRDRPLTGPRELLREVAFAPQFSIAHGKLTVGETIDAALHLHQTRPAPARRASILQLVGLEERADTLVEKLSGGQLRRLGLALELTTDPACLLCDEVTSGLDPRSEDQILALLRSLVAHQGRTVVCVIHNLAKLTQFDTITVVYEGSIVFQGPLPAMLAHFQIDDALTLYDRLAEHPLEHWLTGGRVSRPADEARDSEPRPSETHNHATSDGEAIPPPPTPPTTHGVAPFDVGCSTFDVRRRSRPPPPPPPPPPPRIPHPNPHPPAPPLATLPPRPRLPRTHPRHHLWLPLPRRHLCPRRPAPDEKPLNGANRQPPRRPASPRRISPASRRHRHARLRPDRLSSHPPEPHGQQQRRARKSPPNAPSTKKNAWPAFAPPPTPPPNSSLPPSLAPRKAPG